MFYPADFETSASDSFPVLGFGHGAFQGGEKTPVVYSPLYNALASFGFVVVVPRSCNIGFCNHQLYSDMLVAMRAVLSK